MLADRFGYKPILSLSAEQFIGEIHKRGNRRGHILAYASILSAAPSYACFSLELSFSGKKKAEKEQLKHLSIYLDRDSKIGLSRHKHFFALKIKAW